MALFDFLRRKQRNYNVTWTINKYGEFVYPDDKANAYINDGYKSLPNVYALISFILSKTTIVPFEIYKVKSPSKERKYRAMMNNPRNFAKALQIKSEAYEKVEGTALEKLLLSPIAYQALGELWWEIDGYKMMTGNSYLYPIIVGSTSEMHNIPAPCVDIKVGGGPFSPELSYKVNYLEDTLPGEDVIHFKYWNPITSDQSPSKQFKGLSPLQSCRLLLGKYKDADLTQGFQFTNMGPGGMITGKTNSADGLTEEQAVSIQDKFKQQHQGVHKAGDVLVTPSALTWTAFGLSPVDLNITEGKREMLAELCNVFNAPIGLFSDTNSTENNMIESRKSFITDAVIPIVEARKEVLNKFLAPKFDPSLRIEFDYSIYHELQDDIEKQARTATTMYWTSPNEKRALTGYDQDPDPNMDKKYFPAGLVSLDELSAPLGEINDEFLDPTKGLKYNPDQPRDPAGSPTGGQWSSGTVGKSEIEGMVEKEFDDKFEIPENGEIVGSHYRILEINGLRVKIRVSDHLPDLSNIEEDFDDWDFFVNVSRNDSGGYASSLSQVEEYMEESWNGEYNKFVHSSIESGSTREDIVWQIADETYRNLPKNKSKKRRTHH